MADTEQALAIAAADRASATARSSSPEASAGPSIQHGDSLVIVVACKQCRSRKVKCDSTRPACKNCQRRSDPCNYDVAPNRRGPDKQPGTRQRLWKKRPADLPPTAPKKKRDTTVADTDGAGQTSLQGPQRTNRSRRTTKASNPLPEDIRRIRPLSSTPSTSGTDSSAFVQITGPSFPGCNDQDLDQSLRAVGFSSLEGILRMAETEATTRPVLYGRDGFSPEPMQAPGPSSFAAAITFRWEDYDQLADGRYVETLNPQNLYIPRGPSSSFLKSIWWDSLLPLYSVDRAQSSQRIFQDLNFLLNNSIYWLSFVHVPQFLANLSEPASRMLVQPSIVLSALALAALMKSSETGLGADGRRFALWLRDAAQSSLDASVAASWIEPSLAQAAFFLALFEATAHPEHSTARATSAVFLLDSLIHALSLTTMDAHDPRVTLFSPDAIPDVLPRRGIRVHPQLQDGWIAKPPARAVDGTITTCTCGTVDPSLLVQLGNPEATAEQLLTRILDDPTRDESNTAATPLLHFMPKKDMASEDDDPALHFGLRRATFESHWPDPYNVAEIQREESRRLCWSSMMLVTALREYTPQLDYSAWKLHITDHRNFALMFPGESSVEADSSTSIWALHSRAAVLWNSCHNIVLRSDWPERQTELVGKAWMEINALEDALQQHSCPKGHGIPYAGQEYLLQLKLLISKQFSRSVPLPYTLNIDKFTSKEWIAHREGIATHVRKLAYFVTRFGAFAASIALSKRPLSVWWAMYQIKAGVQVWRADPTMKKALEQSIDFLALTDFITEVYPSESQRRYYEDLRNELIQCCILAGINVPAAVPIPGLKTDRAATMIPSYSLSVQASSSDILMAPLD